MTNTAAAVVKIAVKSWPTIAKNWPKIISTLGLVVKIAHDNPGIPDWFRKRLIDLPRRLDDLQKRRGQAAKIRGVLDVIKDVARDAQLADDGSVDAASFIRRADSIERGVLLAEAQARAERKVTLKRLKDDTAALLTELLGVVARVNSIASRSIEEELPSH